VIKQHGRENVPSLLKRGTQKSRIYIRLFYRFKPG